MTLPDFLIIGAAKAGTTSIYRYLNQHPQIFFSPEKEPCFFSSRYHKGLDWYESLFEKASESQICGEASTPYTHWTTYMPEIPERIYNTLPNVKLIYILRNPIERAYSQYIQQIKILIARSRQVELSQKSQILEYLLDDGCSLEEATYYIENIKTPFKIPETFEQLVKRRSQLTDKYDYVQRADIIAASKYIQQINMYLKFFPRERFLFLFFDDLKNNPRELLSKITDFLEVDRNVDLVGDKLVVANKTSDFFDDYTISKMMEPWKKNWLLRNIRKLIPDPVSNSIYSQIKRIFLKKQLVSEYVPEKMTPETRQLLLAEFAESNNLLSDFLNVDLSHWNQ